MVSRWQYTSPPPGRRATARHPGAESVEQPFGLRAPERADRRDPEVDEPACHVGALSNIASADVRRKARVLARLPEPQRQAGLPIALVDGSQSRHRRRDPTGRFWCSAMPLTRSGPRRPPGRAAPRCRPLLPRAAPGAGIGTSRRSASRTSSSTAATTTTSASNGRSSRRETSRAKPGSRARPPSRPSQNSARSCSSARTRSRACRW